MNTLFPKIHDGTREMWKEKDVAFRSIDLFTTSELVAELCEREGVSSFRANRGTLCYDITSDKARILVVKE